MKMNDINVTYNITGHMEDYGGDVAQTAMVFDPCAAENDTGKEYAAFYRTAQFVTGLICYPIICLVGLTGNTLTLIVLQHKKMVTSTNVILSALALADTIKLLNDVLYFLVTVLLRTHPGAGNRMLGYMYPTSHYIFNEAVCVTAWLTVCVAIERYVCVPYFLYRKPQDLTKVKKRMEISLVRFLGTSGALCFVGRCYRIHERARNVFGCPSPICPVLGALVCKKHEFEGLLPMTLLLHPLLIPTVGLTFNTSL